MRIASHIANARSNAADQSARLAAWRFAVPCVGDKGASLSGIGVMLRSQITQFDRYSMSKPD